MEDSWTDLSSGEKALEAWAGPIGDWFCAAGVKPNTKNPRILQAKPGQGILVNGQKGRTVDLQTKQKFKDIEVHVEFLIPKGSNSGVKFEGLYEIQILDSFGVKNPKGSDCGGIYPRAEEEPKYHHIDKGVPPRTNASRPAGEWQTLDVTFQAPRFDAQNKKVANARFIKVVLNGRVIHENVEVQTPTGSAWRLQKEMPEGPLLLQGTHGPVAFRHVRIRPYARADDGTRSRLENWPHWRGPLANGTAPEADPPINWDEKTNIKWKAPLPGRGSASPIVWGDRVFVLAAIKTDRVATPDELPKPDPRFEKKTSPPANYYQFLVLCFDRATGKLRWQRKAAERVPHEGHHTTHSYAAGSPTTDGHFLYASFGSFGIYCYDLDGTLIWQRDLGRINSRLGWGEAVTPVVHGDSLLINWDQEADSALYCLDAKTGATKWKADRNEKTSWNTPLVVEYKGRTQVIVNGTERIRSYDLASGKELWECGGMTVNAIPSVVAADGVVCCVSGYKGAAAYAIPLDSVGDITDTSKILWRYTKGTPYVPSPLLVGNRLYFTQANSALLTVLDTKTGKPLLDQERLPNQTSFYSSPVAAGGRIYLVDQQGTTLVLKQSDKIEVLARDQLDDHFDASPALVGRQLFLRGEKFLYCIEAP